MVMAPRRSRIQDGAAFHFKSSGTPHSETGAPYGFQSALSHYFIAESVVEIDPLKIDGPPGSGGRITQGTCCTPRIVRNKYYERYQPLASNSLPARSISRQPGGAGEIGCGNHSRPRNNID